MERKRTTSQENAKKKFLRDETVTVALGNWPGAEAINALITLMNNFAPGTVIVNYIHINLGSAARSTTFLQARLVSGKVAQEIIFRSGS